MVTSASGLVIKDSFLQANKIIDRDKIKKPGGIFIAIKIIEEIHFFLLSYGQKQTLSRCTAKGGDTEPAIICRDKLMPAGLEGCTRGYHIIHEQHMLIVNFL